MNKGSVVCPSCSGTDTRATAREGNVFRFQVTGRMARQCSDCGCSFVPPLARWLQVAVLAGACASAAWIVYDWIIPGVINLVDPGPITFARLSLLIIGIGAIDGAFLIAKAALRPTLHLNRSGEHG